MSTTMRTLRKCILSWGLWRMRRDLQHKEDRKQSPVAVVKCVDTQDEDGYILKEV